MLKLESARTRAESFRRVDIVVYRISGQQGPVFIPHRFCEECDLAIAAARRAIARVDDPSVTLQVKPWFLYFWRPLLHGGWHAPILTINGEVYSQGIVPSTDGLVKRIRQDLSANRQPAEINQRAS